MTESRFRWVGRPSEEELLGLPAAGTPRTNGFHAAPPPQPPQSAAAIVAEAPRGRFKARNAAVVAAVGAAVGLALGIAQRGLPSEAPGPPVPTVAASSVAHTVAPDRELRSLTRNRTPKAAEARGEASVAPHGETTRKPPGDDGSGDSKRDDDPKPPHTETSDPPLLQANVPGVGTVTVEEPALPDADDVLPVTETLPLP